VSEISKLKEKCMTMNVGKEVAALQRMTVDNLRQKYAEVFQETTNARH